MKRWISLISAVSLFAFMASGCTNNMKKDDESTAGESVKTGLAVISSIAKSKDATAEAAGLAQVDSTVVAVTVGADGKIVKCKIDAAQTKVNFSNAGKVTTDLKTVFKSKQDLGEEYGMKKASAIGKEWNVQADSLATYVVGKTLAEVKGIAVDNGGKPTASDLKSSVTVSISGYIAAIEKAVTNAKDIGSKKSDKLGLGVVTTIDKSKDVAAEAAGLAQAYSYYTATTFDAQGKVTASIMDASQTNVNFTAAGKVTTDLASTFKTKNELGDAYGMKKASGIGKEWNEQAAAFAAYIKGRTVADVKGIAIDAGGKATASDLTGSVTVSIAHLIEVVDKANDKAK